MSPEISFVYQKLSILEKEEIINFWINEGALKESEAHQRVDQVALVARGVQGKILGVSTIFKKLYQPIGKTFFYFRGFIAKDHRRSGIVLDFLKASQKELSDRFNKGEDHEVIGILIKIQNPNLMKGLYQAVLPRTGFVYVGMEDGCHVRISYFENAKIN